jgi:hypothetical protein
MPTVIEMFPLSSRQELETILSYTSTCHITGTRKPLPLFFIENAVNTGSDEASRVTGKHGAEDEFGKLLSLVRRKRSETTKLNSDTTKVGEATESKGGNTVGALTDFFLEGISELLVGYKLVRKDLQADQDGNLTAIIWVDAHQPREWVKDILADDVEAQGNVQSTLPLK